MRAPVPDGVRVLGVAVGGAGIAFIVAQLTRTPDRYPWYDHRVAQVGIGLVIAGILIFFMGAYMRDKKDLEGPGETESRLIEAQRTGVRMRGRSKLEIDGMTIRNQDTSLDTDDDTEIKGKSLNIE
jgi:hypothetical protein